MTSLVGVRQQVLDHDGTCRLAALSTIVARVFDITGVATMFSDTAA
jgi:anti-anti-sigma regulatory factor